MLRHSAKKIALLAMAIGKINRLEHQSCSYLCLKLILKLMVVFAGSGLSGWCSCFESAELVAGKECVAKFSEVLCRGDKPSPRPLVGDVDVRSVLEQTTLTANIVPGNHAISSVLLVSLSSSYKEDWQFLGGNTLSIINYRDNSWLPETELMNC